MSPFRHIKLGGGQVAAVMEVFALTVVLITTWMDVQFFLLKIYEKL